MMTATATAMTFALLTPFPEAEMPRMWFWLQEFKKQMMDDFGPRTPEELEVHRARAVTYAVFHGGEVVGAVWAEHIGDQQFMGHLVFDRELAADVKLASTKAVMRELFKDGARKVFFHLYEDNRAFRIFLRKVGAVLEGRLRKAARRDGEPVDINVMGLFAEEVRA